jgi:hypothetical protein
VFKSKYDLSEEIRAKAVELLNARLADCIDLQTQTKQASSGTKSLSSTSRVRFIYLITNHRQSMSLCETANCPGPGRECADLAPAQATLDCSIAQYRRQRNC